MGICSIISDMNLKNYIKIISLFAVLFLLIVFLVTTFSSRKDSSGISSQVLGERDYIVEINPTSEIYDYNFKIPVNLSTQESGDIKSINTANQTKTEIKNILKIQKINLETEIVRSTDGEAAINQGAWLVPSSYDENGEKILMGHRRYWGADDPRSFWNLNQLQEGDEIKYYDQEGYELSYKVKTVSIRTGEDHSILKASKDNLLKVISCSTPDGSAGSSEKRIVVIAQQI